MSADLVRLMHVFDSVQMDHPDYPDQIGTVRCCFVPVVMRNGSLVECLKCGRQIQEIGDRWIVKEWGKKGIKIHGWN